MHTAQVHLDHQPEMFGKESITKNDFKTHDGKLVQAFAKEYPSIRHVWLAKCVKTKEDVLVVVKEKSTNDLPGIYSSMRLVIYTDDIAFEWSDEYDERGFPFQVDLKERKETQRIIEKYGTDLMSNHSNLRTICASPHKLIEKDEKNVFETCIVLYCRGKGYIPKGEKGFPSELDGIPTDVREGCFLLGIRNRDLPTCLDQSRELRVGMMIHGKETGASGTLGGFLKLPNGEIGFLTCAHVVRHQDGGLQAYAGSIEGYQTSSDSVVGNLFNHSDRAKVSIDAAVVHIDESRCPPDGYMTKQKNCALRNCGFSENYPPVFNGKIVDHCEDDSLDSMLIKCGSVTGLTPGLLQSDGAMVRLENAKLKFPNQGDGGRIIFYHQYVVRSTKDISFFELGDSGSLVFARKKQQGGDKGAPLMCFGMAIGKLLDGGCIVTPIHDILESFGLPNDAFVSFPRDSHSGSEDDHDADEWDDDDGNDPGGGNNKDGKQHYKKSNSFIRNSREKKYEKTKNQQNRSMDFVSAQKHEPLLGNKQMQYSFFTGECKESAAEHLDDAKNGEISGVSSISASTASAQTIATKLTRDASLDNVHTIKRVSRDYDQELSFPGVSAASSLHSDVTLQESVHLSTSLNEQSLQVRPKTKHERNSTSPSAQSDGTAYLTAPPDFSMVDVHAKQYQSPRNTVGRAGTGAEGIFATMDGSHADRYLPQSKHDRGLDANAEHLMASRCSSDMSWQTSPEWKNLSQPSIARKNRHDWSDTLHLYENDDLQLDHPQYQNQTAVPLSIQYSIPNNPLYQSYVDSNTPNAYGHTTERKQVCTSEQSVPPVAGNQQASSAEFNSLLQLLQSTQIKPAAPVPALTYESDSRKITYHGDKSFSLQDHQFSFHTESMGAVVAENPEFKSGDLKNEESTLAESKYIDQKQNPSNANTNTNTFLPSKTLEDGLKIKLTECAFQITYEVLQELLNESLSYYCSR